MSLLMRDKKVRVISTGEIGRIETVDWLPVIDVAGQSRTIAWKDLELILRGEPNSLVEVGQKAS